LTVRRQIYLIRHGKPVMTHGDWHFLGQEDPPLDDEGVEQALALSRQLADVRFAHVYSSDLQRAVQTAALASRVQIASIQTNPAFREVDLGSWEGLDLTTAEESHPEEFLERQKDVAGYRFPGGESFRDVQVRVLAAFKDLLEQTLPARAPGDDGPAEPALDPIMLVAHKNANRSLLCEYMGLPLERMFAIPQEYCCVNLLEAARDDSGRVEVVVRRPLVSDLNLNR
jgi:probable phosphoglycerate mutase